MPGHSPLTTWELREAGYLYGSEAARKIGVYPQTIYRWIDTNLVQGKKETYRRLVKWSAVLKHLGPDTCRTYGYTQDDIWTETPE